MTALQADVVVDADRRQRGHLLAAQAGDPAVQMQDCTNNANQRWYQG